MLAGSFCRGLAPAIFVGFLAACGGASGNGGLDGSIVNGHDAAVADGPFAFDGPPGTGGVIDAPNGGPDSARAAYCTGQGPPITVGDGSSGGTTVTTCTGTIAEDVFRFALCVCQGLSSGAPITTDAYDSRQSGMLTGTGGSVGADSNINMSALLSVGGDLIVEGAATLQSLAVNVDLQTSDTLSVDSTATIMGNASVNGDVKCNGQLTVGGTLTFPTTRTLTAQSPHIGNQTVRAAVNVPPPCDCDAASIFNIAAYVTEAATNNDNASINFDQTVLTNFTGTQNITLPCGRFYLDRIGGSGAINLSISGRTALFVGNDVNLNGPFTVTLSGVGELDLFINGGLFSSNPLNFGDMAAPGRVRIYMGGSRNVNLSAGSVLYGNLYAPQSALVTSGTLDVYGSIFVNSFNPSAAVNIHQDVSVISDGTCPGDNDGGATMCTRCEDCGGQACIGGECGSCQTSADCCAPLVCNGGTCGFLIQ